MQRESPDFNSWFDRGKSLKNEKDLDGTIHSFEKAAKLLKSANKEQKELFISTLIKFAHKCSDSNKNQETIKICKIALKVVFQQSPEYKLKADELHEMLSLALQNRIYSIINPSDNSFGRGFSLQDLQECKREIDILKSKPIRSGDKLRLIISKNRNEEMTSINEQKKLDQCLLDLVIFLHGELTEKEKNLNFVDIYNYCEFICYCFNQIESIELIKFTKDYQDAQEILNELTEKQGAIIENADMHFENAKLSYNKINESLYVYGGAAKENDLAQVTKQKFIKIKADLEIAIPVFEVIGDKTKLQEANSYLKKVQQLYKRLDEAGRRTSTFFEKPVNQLTTAKHNLPAQNPPPAKRSKLQT